MMWTKVSFLLFRAKGCLVKSVGYTKYSQWLFRVLYFLRDFRKVYNLGQGWPLVWNSCWRNFRTVCVLDGVRSQRIYQAKLNGISQGNKGSYMALAQNCILGRGRAQQVTIVPVNSSVPERVAPLTLWLKPGNSFVPCMFLILLSCSVFTRT